MINYSLLRQSGKTQMITEQLKRLRMENFLGSIDSEQSLEDIYKGLGVDMEAKMTLQQLKEMLISYDKSNNSWPENKYEGWAVYNFITGYLDLFSDGIDLDDWEKNLEN